MYTALPDAAGEDERNVPLAFSLKDVDDVVKELIKEEDARADETRIAVTQAGFKLPCMSDETSKQKLERLLQDCEIMPENWRKEVREGYKHEMEDRRQDSSAIGVSVKEVETTIKFKIVRAWEAPFQDRWCRALKLFVMFVTERTPLLVEVAVVLVAYYSDVVLDFLMMRTFLGYHDHWFFRISVFGIVMGLFYSLLEMVREVNSLQDTYGVLQGRKIVQILVIGCLLPLQLHMMAIGIFSLWEGRPHIFLYTSKLAESVVESTISGCVQTYALIYREMSSDEMRTGYISIGLSYFSMAFAFTSFDRRTHGLASLPGVAPGWLWNRGALCWVLLVRLCEVTSRITFIGLFQRAIRDETIMGVFPVGVLVGADGLLMFIMIFIFQTQAHRSHDRNGACLVGLRSAAQYCIPSTIAFINPMLSSGNICSVPFSVYYFVRLSEIVLMCVAMWKMEVYHGPHDGASINGTVLVPFDGIKENNLYGLDAFLKEFEDDYLIIGAFGISTILWLVLGPIVRKCAADDVLLLNREMLYNQRFSPLKDMLCHRLMPVIPPRKQLTIGSRIIWKGKKGFRRSLEFNHICSQIIQSKLEQLKLEVLKRRRGHTFGQGHSNRTQSFSEESSMSATKWRTLNMRKPDMPVDANPLWLWKWGMTRLHEEIDMEAMVVPPLPLLLQELVHLGYNLGGYLKSRQAILDLDCAPKLQALECSKKKVYLEYLQGVNCILRDVESQERFRDTRAIEMVLRIVPTWPPRGQTWLKEELQMEKRLYIEKCELIVNCLRLGWRIHGAAFHSLALRLMTCFDARPLLGQGGLMEIVGEKDSRFVCIAQFLALVKVWMAMGSEVVVPIEWQAKLFRRNYEVRCFCDGVKFQMELRGQSGQVTEHLRNKEIRDAASRNMFLSHVDKNMMFRDKALQDDDFPERLRLSTNTMKLDFLDEVLNATRLRAVSVTKISSDAKSEPSAITSLAELHGALHAINLKAEKCSVTLVGLKELEKMSKVSFRDRMKRKDIRLIETVMLQYCNAVLQEDLLEVLEHDQSEVAADGTLPRPAEEVDAEVRAVLKELSQSKEALISNCLEVLADHDNHLEVFRALEVDPQTAVAYAGFRAAMLAAAENAGEMPRVEDIRAKKRQNLDALHEFEEVYEGFKIFLRSVKRHFGSLGDIDMDQDEDAETEGAPFEGSMHSLLLRADLRVSDFDAGALWSKDIQDKCKEVHAKWITKYKELREAVTEYWGEQEQVISMHHEQLENHALEMKKKAEKEKLQARDEKEQATLEKKAAEVMLAEVRRGYDEALELYRKAELQQRYEEEARKQAEAKEKEAKDASKKANFEERMAKEKVEEVRKEKEELARMQEQLKEEARQANFKLDQQRLNLQKKIDELKKLSPEELKKNLDSGEASSDCNMM